MTRELTYDAWWRAGVPPASRGSSRAAVRPQPSRIPPGETPGGWRARRPRATTPMTTIGDVRSRYRAAALRRGISPRDVDLLLGDLLGRSLGWLIAHGEEPVDAALLDALLARRSGGALV